VEAAVFIKTSRYNDGTLAAKIFVQVVMNRKCLNRWIERHLHTIIHPYTSCTPHVSTGG